MSAAAASAWQSVGVIFPAERATIAFLDSRLLVRIRAGFCGKDDPGGYSKGRACRRSV
jgi:hypothetical protein